LEDRPKEISCSSASLWIKNTDLDSTISRGGGAQAYEAVFQLPDGPPRHIVFRQAAFLYTNCAVVGPGGS